ncbi:MULTISPECIES: hypothetical protein [Actinosynnema]|uniref:variant leucine-rich repeat-containing protein n=1 Tax=Actinosynnema TaxID=40566 RepID=UPI0020A57E3E|nr:hypothetical protein [Actinosynnema pretiosum]
MPQYDVRLSGVAENPALPAELLDRFIAIAGPELRRELARRGDLSPAQARALLACGDESIVAALLESGAVVPGDVPLGDDRVACVVAARPGADPELVRRLAAHPDVRVRAWLAEHGEGLPVDVVTALVRDPVAEVAQEAALFQPLTAELAAELLAHPSPDLRKALSRNGSTPPDVLLALCGHPESWVRWDLVEHPNLPRGAVVALLSDGLPAARWAAARNPLVPQELLRALADDPDSEVRQAVLRNPVVPLDVLVALVGTTRTGHDPLLRIVTATHDELRAMAASPVRRLRVLVAAREDLPTDLLEEFAEDEDVVVVKAVIANPALPAQRLRALADRHGPRLHHRLAQNPNCPPDLLDRMANDPETPRKAYRAIATHPNAGPGTLLRCLTDERGAEEAASHPNLPTSAFRVLLAEDAPWKALSRAAANPALPVELMAELLNPAQPACVER